MSIKGVTKKYDFRIFDRVKWGKRIHTLSNMLRIYRRPQNFETKALFVVEPYAP